MVYKPKEIPIFFILSASLIQRTMKTAISIAFVLAVFGYANAGGLFRRQGPPPPPQVSDAFKLQIKGFMDMVKNDIVDSPAKCIRLEYLHDEWEKLEKEAVGEDFGCEEHEEDDGKRLLSKLRALVRRNGGGSPPPPPPPTGNPPPPPPPTQGSGPSKRALIELIEKFL